MRTTNLDSNFSTQYSVDTGFSSAVRDTTLMDFKQKMKRARKEDEDRKQKKILKPKKSEEPTDFMSRMIKLQERER